MSLRTVRLDEESEQILAEIRRATGTSVSGALKKGLVALRDGVRASGASRPYELFSQLDLGAGGSALAAGRRAKFALPKLLRRRRTPPTRAR
jgi:hypothetical protein